MSKNKFCNILQYLTEKQGGKGKYIKDNSLEMADYLLSANKYITVEEKRRLFAIRNKMSDIPNNFSKINLKVKCFCGEIEEMDEQLYKCGIFFMKKCTAIILKNKQKYLEEWKTTLEKRKSMKESEIPGNPKCDLI